MRESTVANKLAELLGIKDKVEIPDKFLTPKEKKQKAKRGWEPVNEEDIQNFRQVQGVSYYLQAPMLFQHKVCKHCGEEFLVSRRFVAFCSYLCIKKDMEANGFEWLKGKDLEALANDPHVYGGNEPIWIKNLDKLQKALEHLTQLRTNA